MRDIRVAAAQFEHRNADTAYNLSRIRHLTAAAVTRDAQLVSFHECSITGYSFAQSLTRDELFDIAHPLDGPVIEELIEIAREFRVPVAAGLFERDGDRIHNTYVCVTGDAGVIARFRKLHAFVNPHLTSGDGYCVFELLGCRIGILICYDNNLVENVRITALEGAEVILMPHVTGCLPSVMPGRGLVDPELWERRERDPVPLRLELNGPKGRDWLMRWLPARAYENGVYAVFTNPIGMDDGQVRNGQSMILDPFGEVLAECHELGDDVVVALCTADKLEQSSGRRYLRARRPELYSRLTAASELPPLTEPGWKLKAPSDHSE